MTVMINMVVNSILEVMFGLFLISVLTNFLFGVDLVEEIMKLYNMIVYGKKPNDKKESGK